MTTERLTPDAIAAELDLIDGDARVVLGEVVVTIAFTNAAVKTLSPREMAELGAYLRALIDRAPIKGQSPAYAPHRMVLGQLATELEGFAAAAGEPIGLEADLRAATSKAEERRIRERLADEAAAYDRHIDDVLLSHAAQQATTTLEEPAPDKATSAATPETDDVLAWL